MKFATTVLVSLLTVSVVHASPDYAALTPLEGVVRHSPLRLEVDSNHGHDGVIPSQAVAPALRAVLAQSALEGRTLEFQVDGVRTFAFKATVGGDTVVLDSTGFGAAQLGTLRTNQDVLVTGMRSGAGPNGASLQYYAVRADELKGLVPASSLVLGESHPIAGAVGDVLAPAFAAGSTARDARFFHPNGDVFRARVESHSPAKFRQTADGLAGAAVIRMGQGFWKVDPTTGQEPNRFDALALAIRFYDPTAGGPSPAPRAGDFDLLVASWSERLHHFLWRTPFKTDVHDFFANDYFPAIPFQLEGKEVWVRVIPGKVDEPQGPSRIGSLLTAVEAGQALFHLEVSEDEEAWTRLATITLEEYLPDFDQEALRYHPTAGGRGFQPTGWVTRIRRPVYRASQDARAGITGEVKKVD